MGQAAEKLDYTVQVKTALARVEKLSDDIERPRELEQITMCREAWRDYGAGLLAQRRLMPNKKVFGAWVKANGLDTGRAKNHAIRSCAMWLAEHWDDVKRFNINLTNHHPMGIRQECRDAGYEWAGGSRRKQATADKKLGWTLAVAKHYPGGILPPGFSGKTLLNIKRRLEGEVGYPIPARLEIDSPIARELAAIISKHYSRANPTEEQTARAAEREALPRSWQDKFDSLVKREMQFLRDQFSLAVATEAKAKAEVETEELRRFYRTGLEKAKAAEDKYNRWSVKVNGVMTHDEFRIVLGCLHPDRPHRSAESLGRAFAIFIRLEKSIKWPD